MGQRSSKLSSLRRAVRDNQEGLEEVELKGEELTDQALRKLAEAFQTNKYDVSCLVVVGSSSVWLPMCHTPSMKSNGWLLAPFPSA